MRVSLVSLEYARVPENSLNILQFKKKIYDMKNQEEGGSQCLLLFSRELILCHKLKYLNPYIFEISNLDYLI